MNQRFDNQTVIVTGRVAIKGLSVTDRRPPLGKHSARGRSLSA